MAYRRSAHGAPAAIHRRAMAMTVGDSGRTSGPAEELVAAGYAWEVADAPLLHDALNLADLAHAVELADRKVLPDRARHLLLRALLDLAALPAEAVDYHPGHGELYESRERHLAIRIG